MNRTTRLILALWLVALAGAGAWIAWDAVRAGRSDGDTETASQAAAIGGPFSLIDQDGNRRTDQDYRGKLMLIYFGFTYCPDVCPTGLTIMANALDQLGAEADQVAPIFITVDPERDTPEAMKAYVAQFSPRLIGLTGSEAEVAAAAKAYRVYYAKAPGAGDAPYLMDHTSLFYLMDREGRFITHFTHNSQAEDMVAAVQKALKAAAR